MNLSDLTRNSYMLRGSHAKKGYMRWWHSFSGTQPESGEMRTFFIEFYIINPGIGGSTPILGQHPYYKKQGMKPSYVMVKAGVFPDKEGNSGRQLHAFYPFSALQATGCPLIMQVGDENTAICLYSEDRLKGSVEVSREEARHRSLMSDAGSMEWDLKVQKAVSCNMGFWSGAFSRAMNLLENYWHGEGIRSFFQGSVLLDGVLYEVTPETSYGYADKHWGRSANMPWLQFSCGKLFSQRIGEDLRHSVLAMKDFYPRFLIFPRKRRLFLQLTYMGEDFEFSHCKWETKETNKRFIWRVLAKNKTAVVKVTGSCKKEEMFYMNYESPGGNRDRRPLWSGAEGAGTIQIFRRLSGGRELLDTLKLENALCLYRADRG